MTSRISAFLLALLLAACGNDVQTSSGQAYLARAAEAQATPPARGGAAPSIDRAVLAVANVEPLLRFPARLGLARLERGRMTPVPPDEADAWLALGQRLGPGYGEFVPINPMVAQLAAGSVDERFRNPIDLLRLGAARQHVDAVLIYEVQQGGRDRETIASMLDLTIVGAFLVPSRVVTGESTAYATLVDVRNGYTYGNAMAQGRNSGLATLGQSRDAVRAAGNAAGAEAVQNLTREVETMMTRLRTQLATLPPPGTRASRRRS